MLIHKIERTFTLSAEKEGGLRPLSWLIQVRYTEVIVLGDKVDTVSRLRKIDSLFVLIRGGSYVV